MDTNQFKSTILTHTGGFLLSTGDQNGDCNTTIDFGSLFFDSAAMLGENWLCFKNKLDEKEENGKTVGDIYALGNASIYMNYLKAIEEYDGNYLVDQFLVKVQRMFTLQLEDEAGNSLWLTVGLL